MAARVMAVPATGRGLPERFQRLAEDLIGEGNFLAEERLWEVRMSGPMSITISSVQWEGNAIECTFDPDAGSLRCCPGAVIGHKPLVFDVVPDQNGILRRCGADLTLEEAVQLVLDELVWMDDDESMDPCNQAAGRKL